MKVIVLIHHDRHTEDILKVYPYSEENLAKVKESMQKYWKDGEWGWFGDLPAENGKQFGYDDSYYSSYSIVEMCNE